MSDIAERRTQPVTKCTDPTWSLYNKGISGGVRPCGPARTTLQCRTTEPAVLPHTARHSSHSSLEDSAHLISTGSLQSRQGLHIQNAHYPLPVFSPEPAFRCRKHAPRPLVSRGPPNLPPLILLPLFPTSNLHAARLRDLTCAHLVDVLDGVVREQAGCLLARLMVAELICGGLLRALELPFEPEREGCRAVKGRCGGAFDK